MLARSTAWDGPVRWDRPLTTARASVSSARAPPRGASASSACSRRARHIAGRARRRRGCKTAAAEADRAQRMPRPGGQAGVSGENAGPLPPSLDSPVACCVFLPPAIPSFLCSRRELANSRGPRYAEADGRDTTHSVAALGLPLSQPRPLRLVSARQCGPLRHGWLQREGWTAAARTPADCRLKAGRPS